MAEEPQPTTDAVVRVLAALSPAADQQASKRTIPLDWFRWLPAGAVRAFITRPLQSAEQVAAVPIDHKFAERLAAIDQIRFGQRSLRIGWLFVAGTTTDADGKAARVFRPMVTVPVTVQRLLVTARLLPAGDVELTPLIEDAGVRHGLEEHLEFGGGSLDGMDTVAIPGALLGRLDRLRRFAVAAAEAAGLPAREVIPAGAGPDELMGVDRLRVVAGAAVYAVTDTGGMSRAATLETWATIAPGGYPKATALESLYLGSRQATDADGALAEEPVESAYPLTPTQTQAVVRSRHEAITVVSGAPGTGKSHTIVALACDALARGETVLVAAKSDDAVDALIDLLDRAPGPDPVVFGSHGRRDALAKRLAAGQLQPLSGHDVAERRHRLDAAIARRDELWSRISDNLAAESLVGTMPSEQARLAAPRLFDPDTDLEAVRALVTKAATTGGGWLERRRRRVARGELDQASGSLAATELLDIEEALAVASASRRIGDVIAAGGLDLRQLWVALEDLEREVRRLVGEWLAADSRSTRRINESTLPSLTALATALRSGRAARRAQLSHLDRKLLRALPLWIGSLPDIDDLLPMSPGLVDLVILDEASSIDQPLAAAALLRATRAVIVGDPHQLRHVSFLSDDQIRTAITEAGLDRFADLASRLDVRRNSIFDVATSVSPVTMLDEHFRSDPHLIDWVAQRIYGGDLKVATRTPATECRDCIQITYLEGQRNRGGVVEAELACVVAALKDLRAAGAGNVGVITPFRAQADALEEVILAAFSADDLKALDLRVGTVHAFQGNERDVVLASAGVGADAPANAWQFVGDTHLFDVMVTRARKSFSVITSAEPPRGSLVADYFQQADTPPGPPPPAGPLDEWSRRVADHLLAAGVVVHPSYPTGRHVVDICLDAGEVPVSVECTVHPEGPGAHIERHLALRRGGWRVLDAFRSRWEGREAELTITLVQMLALTPDRLR